MGASFSLRTALRSAPAVLAATISLSVGLGSTLAPASGSSLALTIYGDPGTTILFDPYPFGGSFDVSIRTNAGAMVGGSPADFSLNFADSESNAVPTPGGDGGYQQDLTGSGNFTITDPAGIPLGQATLSGGTVYATPGASSAVIQLDVTAVTGAYFPPALSKGYLVLQGATQLPVDLVKTNPLCYADNPCTEPYFAIMRLDWTATYQSTPYVPASGMSTVPEPSTWTLMALGFVGLGFAGRRRSRRAAAV
jgi:PEP-CTERM motif